MDFLQAVSAPTILVFTRPHWRPLLDKTVAITIDFHRGECTCSIKVMLQCPKFGIRVQLCFMALRLASRNASSKMREEVDGLLCLNIVEGHIDHKFSRTVVVHPHALSDSNGFTCRLHSNSEETHRVSHVSNSSVQHSICAPRARGFVGGVDWKNRTPYSLSLRLPMEITRRC